MISFEVEFVIMFKTIALTFLENLKITIFYLHVLFYNLAHLPDGESVYLCQTQI